MAQDLLIPSLDDLEDNGTNFGNDSPLNTDPPADKQDNKTTDAPKNDQPKPDDKKESGIPSLDDLEQKNETDATDTGKSDKGTQTDGKDQPNKDTEVNHFSKLTEVVYEGLGFNPSDYKEEIGAIKSMQDFKNHFADIVKENIEGAINNLLSDEDLKLLYEVKSKGGKLEDFVKIATTDYSNVESLTDEQVVRVQLEKNGLSKEKIDAKIIRFKELNALKEEADDYRDVLKKEVESNKQNHAKKLEEEHAKFTQQVKEYQKQTWEQLNKIKEMEGLSLTEDDRKAIFNYMFKPINNKNQTQALLDMNDTESIIRFALVKLKSEKERIEAINNKAKKQVMDSLVNPSPSNSSTSKTDTKDATSDSKVDEFFNALYK